jgi:hypothetical protein
MLSKVSVPSSQPHATCSNPVSWLGRGATAQIQESFVDTVDRCKPSAVYTSNTLEVLPIYKYWPPLENATEQGLDSKGTCKMSVNSASTCVHLVSVSQQKHRRHVPYHISVVQSAEKRRVYVDGGCHHPHHMRDLVEGRKRMHRRSGVVQEAVLERCWKLTLWNDNVESQEVTARTLGWSGVAHGENARLQTAASLWRVACGPPALSLIATEPFSQPSAKYWPSWLHAAHSTLEGIATLGTDRTSGDHSPKSF